MKKVANEVFVVNQPTRKCISFIMVDSEKITDKVHESIDKIHEFSDIFFIFTKKMRGVNYQKFTTLYRGCAWMYLGENWKEGQLYMRALSYTYEVFEKHILYSFMTTTSLEKADIDLYKTNLLNVGTSSLPYPVFSRVRYSSEALLEFYKETEEETREEKIEGILRKVFKFKRKGEELPEFDYGFSTHTTTSNIIVIPKPSIFKILEFGRTDDKGFIRSFGGIFDLIASLTDYIGMQIVNQDIEEYGKQ